MSRSGKRSRTASRVSATSARASSSTANSRSKARATASIVTSSWVPPSPPVTITASNSAEYSHTLRAISSISSGITRTRFVVTPRDVSSAAIQVAFVFSVSPASSSSPIVRSAACMTLWRMPAWLARTVRAGGGRRRLEETGETANRCRRVGVRSDRGGTPRTSIPGALLSVVNAPAEAQTLRGVSCRTSRRSVAVRSRSSGSNGSGYPRSFRRSLRSAFNASSRLSFRLSPMLMLGRSSFSH
jgi:hypothetical protein